MKTNEPTMLMVTGDDNNDNTTAAANNNEWCLTLVCVMIGRDAMRLSHSTTTALSTTRQ